MLLLKVCVVVFVCLPVVAIGVMLNRVLKYLPPSYAPLIDAPLSSLKTPAPSRASADPAGKGSAVDVGRRPCMFAVKNEGAPYSASKERESARRFAGNPFNKVMADVNRQIEDAYAGIRERGRNESILPYKG